MRRFEFSKLPASLRKLIKEKHPVDEDIGLYERGRLVAVVIMPRFYRFALEMAEKIENKIDLKSARNFSVWRKRMNPRDKKSDKPDTKDASESHEVRREKFIHKGKEKTFEVWDSKTRQLRKKDK